MVATYWIASPPADLAVAATRIAKEHYEAITAQRIEAGEEPEPAPEPITDPFAAAQAIMGNPEIMGALSGTDPAEDFKIACEKMGVLPHPAIVKGFSAAPATSISVRGWQVELQSLTALMLALEANQSVTTLKMWGTDFNGGGYELALLAIALPGLGLTSLALEGEPVPAVELVKLLEAEKLTSLSLRCAGLKDPLAPEFLAALTANTTLTSLSLFGNPLGDDGAEALFAALRTNTTLTSLDLGRTSIGDFAAAAILKMVSPEEQTGAPSAAAAAAVEPAEEGAGEEGVEEEAMGIPPNTTLATVNLSFNEIGTPGRASCEAAQAIEGGAITSLILKGNPCLTCGPTASMPAGTRALIASSWAALGELEGGAEGAVKKIVAASLDLVADAQPIVGYSPPVAPEPTGEEGEDPKEEVLEGVAAIEAWPGLEGLASTVCKSLTHLVGLLDDPEALKESLRYEYGTAIASRGITPGGPYEAFGEQLVKGLGEALGEGLSEEAGAAWLAAYNEAAVVMQEAYALSQWPKPPVEAEEGEEPPPEE